MPVRQVVGGARQAEVQISVKSFWTTLFICDALLGSFFLGNVSCGKFFFWKVGGKRAESVR